MSGGTSDAHDDRLPTGKFSLVNLVPLKRPASENPFTQTVIFLMGIRCPFPHES